MAELRVRPLFTGESLRVSAIERVEVDTHRGRRSCHVQARLTPTAIVISGPGGLRALDMNGEALSIDALATEAPGLVAQIDAVKLPGGTT